MSLDEGKIDRRVHWIQLAITAVVVATAWCVKLEFTTSRQEDDLKQYKRDAKMLAKEVDNNIDDLTHRLIVLETIQACRDGKHECAGRVRDMQGPVEKAALGR